MADIRKSVEMLTQAQKALFEEAYALASSQKISLPEASILISTEPRHYVRVRSITNVSMRDYLLVRKIEKLRAQLASELVVTNDHPIVEVLEKYFAQLEFGVSPFSPAERKLIREAILGKNHSVKTVQAAFRSLAVSKSKSSFRFREFSIQHVRTMGLARDLSVGTFIALCALIFREINVDGYITCSLAGWTLFASHATAAIAFARWLLQDAVQGTLILKSMKLGNE